MDLAKLQYPDGSAARDRWIVELRPPRNPVDARTPYLFFIEDERALDGALVPVATVFLTNRECPWRCVMCDLWKNTLAEPLPAGAIPQQIAYALEQLGAAQQIKLYNSGSFFDPHAIPVSDYPAIAGMTADFERVIVECHPSLVGERVTAFKNMLTGRLEVAMGLETAHPEALKKLNKRMTLDSFSSAARFLRGHDVDLRVFVIVQPPFVAREEALHWAQRSIDFAFDCGATAVTVIPARVGNGAMEVLQQQGLFTAPGLRLLEASLEYGIGLDRGRVFADLWDVERLDACFVCAEERMERLRKMNLGQAIQPVIECPACAEAA